jgi:hypothetical protein
MTHKNLQVTEIKEVVMIELLGGLVREKAKNGGKSNDVVENKGRKNYRFQA